MIKSELPCPFWYGMRHANNLNFLLPTFNCETLKPQPKMIVVDHKILSKNKNRKKLRITENPKWKAKGIEKPRE